MKNKVEDPKKSNILYSRLFVISFVVLMLSVGVFAFFTFNYDKDVTYQVVGSQGDLLVLVDLTNQVFNVSESLNNSQNLTVVNQNGGALMNYTLNVNVTNLDPGNCTINNDVSFELNHIGSGIIPVNGNISMSPGVNDFVFKAIAVNNRVCPQNITSSLSFAEI